jgi:hypothetical protein
MNIIPNTTGTVALRLLDLATDKPTVFLTPVIGWSIVDREATRAVLAPDAGGSSYEALHDTKTGATWTAAGEVWESLDEAVSHLVKVHRLEVRDDS